MSEAVRLRVRYYTTDHNGQTRAERNTLAGAPVPKIEVPKAGQSLWDDFWEMCQFRHERDRLSPAQMAEYAAFRGIKWQRWEMTALAAMDAKYCETMAEEMRFNQERMNAGKSKGRRAL